jgi:hypothetical protein
MAGPSRYGLATALVGLACITGLQASDPQRQLDGAPATAGQRANAIQTFNSVHSALRQWGSSLHHNGMSFYPVTIPEGNVFYHGAPSSQRPSGLEWLAFEMEHAANFALSGPRMPFHVPQNEQSRPESNPNEADGAVPERLELRSPSTAHDQLPMPPDDTGGPPNRPPPLTPTPWGRGYLQTYRAQRPLHLIYIDGQAAAKSDLGTLDSQDYILLDQSIPPRDPDSNLPRPGLPGVMTDGERGVKLCALAKDWGVDGWLRMEAGFEIIYCDFAAGSGLELVSTRASPYANETGGDNAEPWAGSGVLTFAWLRACAERYHGHVLGRAEIDFSGMVSAFAFGINTTNADATRLELPRILDSKREERRAIRDRLGEVIRTRKGKAATAINWQAITDDIVTRFSSRLAYMALDKPSAANLRFELATLLNPFMDFPADAESSHVDYGHNADLCATHYFGQALARRETWTPEDASVYEALRSVSQTICQTLLDARATLLSGTDDASAARRAIRDLVDDLRWTTWKECRGGCDALSKICLVPMFPAGAQEDYYAPRCKNISEVSLGYWWDWGQMSLAEVVAGMARV